MVQHQVLWCVLALAMLFRPSEPVNSKRKDEPYDIPIGAGLFTAHPMNFSIDYLPLSITSSRIEKNERSVNEPYFDFTVPRKVTAYSGKTAYLSCRVSNMGNRTVSWIRHTDAHILSVGTYTYTSDQRYVTLHDAETGDWTLLIKWVTGKDAGTYGCQVNTQPVKSYYIMLSVIGTPTAHIAGEGEVFVSLGSTVRLSCILSIPTDYQMFWYHDGELINYDSLRGGISIIVEKSNQTVSTLQIQNTSFKDSGNYTCSPSNANSASAVIHIIKGDQPAAMHKGGAADGNTRAVAMGLLFVLSYNRPAVIPYISLAAMSFLALAI